MTFRGRLVLAATAAVLVVVVLGSIATYLVASNSLLGAIDVNLRSEAQSALTAVQGTPPTIENLCTSRGSCVQVVGSGGTVNPGDPTVLPVSSQAQSSASSQGQAADQYYSTTVGGTAVRELVVALPPQYLYRSAVGFLQLPAGGAVQFTTPLAGVNHELGHLALALWLIVIVGIAVAVLLGLVVGRTVLRPLNSLTRSVEELAESTDVAKRLEPGGPDELGRLRAAFNRLLAALDSSRESQRQLVLDASHELRTPLTSLRTNLEVVRRLEELEPEERDVLISDVLTQMDELTTLVGDLAELARGAQPAVRDEPFRLDQVVLDAVEVATTHGRSRGVVFEPAVAPTWVSGSSTRVERAIDNLLDNALKWSPDGGVVDVTCSDGIVVVRDHGPGVSASDIDFIFDRFYRAPSARGRPGSGLGLAIVAQVARDEGGTVAAYQADGGGALFRFTLPTIHEPGSTDGAKP